MGGLETEIFKIAAIGLAVAMIHTVLKGAGKEEFAHWVTLVGVIVILIFVIDNIGELFTKLRTVFQIR